MKDSSRGKMDYPSGNRDEDEEYSLARHRLEKGKRGQGYPPMLSHWRHLSAHHSDARERTSELPLSYHRWIVNYLMSHSKTVHGSHPARSEPS